jgi:hypothetical protein
MFVRREQESCPFLGFTIQEDKDALILVIDAPENASEAADALFGTPTPQQGIPVKPTQRRTDGRHATCSTS